MTIAKPISFSLPSVDAMISAARGFFQKPEQAAAAPVSEPKKDDHGGT